MEALANASIIAAGQELLEALQQIAYEPKGDAEASHREVLEQCVQIARAALANAIGDDWISPAVNRARWRAYHAENAVKCRALAAAKR